MAILGVTAVVAPASARPPLDDGDATGKGPLGGLSVVPPTLARLDARAPADATVGAAGLIADAAVELVPCDEEPSFLCGTVQVPLDRRNPDDRILGIAFAIVPHSGPQEVADGAIFVTCGGPGCSGTAIATFGFSFIFGDLLETMDVVYVDQRGVGLSRGHRLPGAAVGWPAVRAAAACHDQLGDTASLYSTSDVADDLDDVRAALGYEQIDVFGGSYAGVDMITYAVRHTRARPLGRARLTRDGRRHGSVLSRTHPRRCRGSRPGCAGARRRAPQSTATPSVTSPRLPANSGGARSLESASTRPVSSTT